ncbi:hypothetical protein YC2023_061769 [Brassica napus]
MLDTSHDQIFELHQFCYLRSKQKAQLEYDRRQAEAANYADGHWKIRVKDSRFKICIDRLCNWKSMLRHWGESNWTDYESFVPIPPAITAVQKTSLPGHNLFNNMLKPIHHVFTSKFTLLFIFFPG